MVSSLPFLAPVFLRKAKEYRSKQSRGYGSSGRTRPVGRSGEGYMLSSLSRSGDPHESATRGKGTTTLAYATATGVDSDKQSHSGSEEDMLRRDDRELPLQQPEGAIMKSVSYSVRVDDERGKSIY